MSQDQRIELVNASFESDNSFDDLDEDIKAKFQRKIAKIEKDTMERAMA